MKNSELVICLGLQKSYTTSLYTYLKKTNSISLNRNNKEEGSILNGKLPKNFKSGKNFIDICPLYGIHIHQFCEEIKSMNTPSKFIILYRDPVERIQSHFKMIKRRDKSINIIENIRTEARELNLSKLQPNDLENYIKKIDKVIKKSDNFNLSESLNMIKISSMARIYMNLSDAALVDEHNVCIINSRYINCPSNLQQILDFCGCSNCPSLLTSFPHSHKGSSTRLIDISKISRLLMLNKLPKKLKDKIRRSGFWNFIEMRNTTRKSEKVDIPYDVIQLLTMQTKLEMQYLKKCNATKIGF